MIDVTDVTVITLTRRRSMLVQRAIMSVQAQKSRYSFNHLVLIDDCRETLAALEGFSHIENLEIIYMQREPHEFSGPGRSSRLRNFGVRHSSSTWIAFLDDDNEWLQNHIESLVDCALINSVRAAHSFLQIFNPDGTPYLENRYPWTQNPEEGERIYWEYVRKGVYTPSSNLFRDRADPIEHPDPVRSVDTSAWLLDRELLMQVPFNERFTQQDAEQHTGEDDKLLTELINRREPIACTGLATLKYYLGGYSNSASGVTDETFSWSSE